MMRVVDYAPSLKAEWDAFVEASVNGTFLHKRDYMDYHADRFADCSLMGYDEAGRLVALLPANDEGDVACSHRGLTYGGLIVGARHHATADVLELWRAMLDRLRERGVRTFVYKPVPWIYARYPSDDDIYALFRCGASLESCQPASAVPLGEPLLFNQGAKYGVTKSRRDGLMVAESADLAAFWPLLESVLQERHGARPVHTLAEMECLRARFSREIRLFTAVDRAGELLAGMLVYFTGRVAHAQYIAVSERGRRDRALAAIAKHVIDCECDGAAYFDFGTSCERGGLVLNVGLSEQKYGMGGRPVAYTAWRIAL